MEGEEITVSQGESCVTVDYQQDLTDEQITEAEAYAALYALGEYTYNNVIMEAPEKMCNSVNSDKEDSDSDDGFDETDSDRKVDEEELIRKKSKYEQSFLRDFRQLFSETLSPSRFLKCPPMKIKLRQALSNRLDPSLYKFKPRSIPMHIKAQA